MRHGIAIRRVAQGARWPLTGLVLGVGWAAVARTWMRYVSQAPEFSWEGTLAIGGVSGVAGASLASLEALRRSGARGWRLLLIMPALAMFVSPGAVMLPPAVLGGLALSGRGGRPLRYAATVLAVAAVFLVLVAQPSLPHSTTISIGWYALLCLALAAGWRSAFLPVSSRPDLPARTRPAGHRQPRLTVTHEVPDSAGAADGAGRPT
jgi:hypothetical protein